MKKEKFNFREAYERVDAIKARLNEMAENLEKDSSRNELTAAEKGEKTQLERELSILDMKIKAATPTIELMRREDVSEVNRRIRECIERGQRFELRVGREVASGFGGVASGYGDPATSGLASTVTTGDIVKPLYPKTILSAIGAPLLTGLKGNYQWPVVEAFEATILSEAAELGDTKIPHSKLVAKPERIGIAVPVSREALTETDNFVQVVATEYIPVAVAALMNKIMFSTTKVTGSTGLVGPFVEANYNTQLKKTHKLTYAGELPTLAELVKLKAAVLATNVLNEGGCYVMNEEMKALLEATPKWQGSSAGIVEDGRINGVPVFTTNDVAQGVVHYGAFKYAPQGLFGDMSFIVDPYSQARKNAVDFVFNCDYAITVLRQEAFASLSKASV